MAVLDGADAEGRPLGGRPDPTRALRFALSAHEVTIAQYRRFKPEAKFRVRAEPSPGEIVDDQLPANMVSFTDALRYCRWLSEREGIREDQMCYPPLDQIVDAAAVLSEERRRRTGYRLPTEQEWELAACVATTPWITGSLEQHLPPFAWFAINSGDRLQPSGLLRPNALGFFDIIGNASEWCHPTPELERDERYIRWGNGNSVLRGGYYGYPAKFVRSFTRYCPPDAGYSFTGFRVARTIAPAR
jgi:formylglycine-generating enzyme required for sulfatase activity